MEEYEVRGENIDEQVLKTVQYEISILPITRRVLLSRIN
jgi:hypothetical protein